MINFWLFVLGMIRRVAHVTLYTVLAYVIVIMGMSKAHGHSDADMICGVIIVSLSWLVLWNIDLRDDIKKIADELKKLNNRGK